MMRRDMVYEAEIAWAAGFYEGEGYCGLRNRENGRLKYLRLSIGQRTLWPLEKFQEVVGLGVIRHRVMRGQEIWYYDAGKSSNVLIVAEMLWPWLSPRRQVQIKAAVESYFDCHPKLDRLQLSTRGE